MVGLRLSPDSADPEWYTLWVHDADDEQTRMATDELRLVWAPTANAALALERYLPAGSRSLPAPEVNAVCDIATTLWAIDAQEDGSESGILTSLNLLDDAVISIQRRVGLPGGAVLDRLSSALTQGESLTSTVTLFGGKSAVIEPIIASLGYVFAFSNFMCDGR